MALIDRVPRVTFSYEGDLKTVTLEDIEAGIETALLGEGLPARVVITPIDAHTVETPERKVICENCGEVVAFRSVGADGDDSDIVVPPEDCPLCLESEDA